MKLLKNKMAIVSFSALVLASNPASAGMNVDTEAKADAGAVSQLNTASSLAALGLAQEDALLLISAAKLRKGVAITTVQAEKTSEGGEDSNKDSGVSLSASELLERATELAGDNAGLLALIEDVRDIKERGRIGGAVNGHDDRVRADSVDTYTMRFKGDRRAEVYVEGDGDTDLDLFIYDEDGNLICSDTDRTDQMLCRWTPSWTGKFRVRIKNLGDVYNDYTLYTN
ncbi:hypothetical protein [Amphritea japonica]|uniref:Peptidase C-terminal archaeal/bacterial domain-containing protein n=1 Tax=Amphritea japonica ATCC BAA-1530 TaxID=1278309 RepID=A0A7R6P3U8_9GAMM|nr:hypothetical protein [Amphritea japonica]BBB26733.1 conserved hypothetical protein [Amphritea japonica ATCC BAA-1530]